MPWWIWLIGGLALMGVELTAVDAAFFLMFLGASAVLVGLLELGGAGLPAWGQWLVYAVLSVTSLVLFRKRLYSRLRGHLPGYQSVAAGGLVDVAEDLAVGAETRVRYRGTQWAARNLGPGALAAGARARVVRADGAVLEIEGLPPAGAAGDATQGA